MLDALLATARFGVGRLYGFVQRGAGRYRGCFGLKLGRIVNFSQFGDIVLVPPLNLHTLLILSLAKDGQGVFFLLLEPFVARIDFRLCAEQGSPPSFKFWNVVAQQWRIFDPEIQGLYPFLCICLGLSLEFAGFGFSKLRAALGGGFIGCIFVVVRLVKVFLRERDVFKAAYGAGLLLYQQGEVGGQTAVFGAQVAEGQFSCL